MNSRAVVCICVMLVTVLIFALWALPAGCECTDTCGPGCQWIKTGYGDCNQFYYHRCHGSGCGAYNPFADDCIYICEWENWWSLLCGDCEHVTLYNEYCIE
jgi:hypothetical protein